MPAGVKFNLTPAFFWRMEQQVTGSSEMFAAGIGSFLKLFVIFHKGKASENGSLSQTTNVC